MTNRRLISKEEFKERYPKPMIHPEDIKGTDEKSEQIRVFAWAAINQSRYPQLRWLHAIPNANSQRQVAEGVRAGISDVCLPYPVWPAMFAGPLELHKYKTYSGLYIEMKLEKRRKEKNGGCSDDQIKFIDYANSVGYKAVVCYGWQEAVREIKRYLGGY